MSCCSDKKSGENIVTVVTTYLTRLTKIFYTFGERVTIVLFYSAENQCALRIATTR